MTGVRVAQVVALYMGERRKRNNNPTNPADVLGMLRHHAELLTTVDPGVPTDVLIINNQAGYHHGNLYLDHQLAGRKTPRGTILTETRANVGGSFGAYDHAFQKWRNDYTHWLFLEDDVMITEHDLVREMVGFIDDNPKVGFVALAPISNAPPHSGGGCGLTRRDRLEEVCRVRNGRLPHNEGKNYGQLEAAEVQFTLVYHELGYELRNLPGVSPLAANFERHESQQRFRAQNEGRKVYLVGL